MKSYLRRALVASLSLLGSSLFASLPPTFTAKELAQGFTDTTVLARPRDDIGESAATAAETREGLTVRQRFPRIGNLRILEVPSGDTVEQTVKRLAATGRYAYVEPDRLLHKLATPNDTSFAAQWALNNTGTNGGTVGADIGAVTAWNTRTDASSVIVAVVDSGALLTHTDLAGNLWTNTSGNHGISAVNSNGSTTNDPTDSDSVGHGTHVSGIIGAVGNNSVGIAGVAWKAQLMELRYLHGTDGSGSTSDSIVCLNYALTNGAKIINASYGSSSFSRSEYDAIKKLRDAGIILVAAAGNDGVNNDLQPSYPAAHALDNIVTVASSNRADDLSSFSDYGAGSVDLAAPGESIFSAWISSNTAYATASGTSMAAPHVTGALALLWAQFPNDTYRQLINRLLRNTTKLSVLSGKVQTGGRLNLAAAITSTTSANTPFNDDFASAPSLAGDNIIVRSSNVGATAESGETAHAGNTAAHTLWWTYTATEDTKVTITTSGSKVPVSGGTDTTLDTVLAVYTGSSIGDLTAIASNDDYGSATTSRVDLNVTAGTTYRIAVDGKNGATGYVALNLGVIPGNDNFAAAKTVSGLGIHLTGTTLNATRESGEPYAAGLGTGHSVWYKWTAPSTGHYSLAVFATSTDTVAAVYTGTSVSSLTMIASNDNNAGGSNSDALVSFNATSGVTYYLQVDHTSSSDLGGAFIMTLTDSLWEYPTVDEITGPAAVGSDGTIYFGCGTLENDAAYDTNIYALNADGSRKWRYPTGAATGIVNAGPAVSADGSTVYFGDSAGKFYAMTAAYGSVLWSYNTGDTSITCTPAIGADGTVYVRGSTKLFAFTSSGSLKWTLTINSSAYGTYASPAIGTDGAIYIGTADSDTTGALYAVTDNGNGASIKWSYVTDGQIYTTPAFADDGTVYIGTLSGAFYALTPGTSSATKKWSIALGTYDGADNSITSSPVLAADGTIYFAAYDHKLYALNPTSGATKWTAPLGDEVRACSPAVASDGTVFIGAYDGNVSAYSSSGTFLRNYPAGLRVRSSPVIAGNRLYFGSSDAKLHAFDLGQTNQASAWPMFHRDATRAGRASTAGSITLSSQSYSRSVVAGGSVTLSVTATSGATLAYQWYKNGTAITGATSSTYTITGATTNDAATYTVVVSTSAGSITSSAIVINVLASGTLPSRLSNIAARAYCSTGNNVTIGGFVVVGSAQKRVLIRAVGPSLASQGLSASEILADPTIEVHRNINNTDTVIASNDNWTDDSTNIAATASTLGAFALDASDTKSSGLLTTLSSGVYSFIVKGKNDTSGIVLLEVYDADGTGAISTFSNIATRAYATTGNGVAIGGFVIDGTQPKTVLIRAVGPTLSTQGLSTSEVLADPVIDIYLNANGTNTHIATVDNWTNDAANIRTVGSALGATAIDSSDTKSAALVTSLSPGVYSFTAKGQNDTSGIVLIEVYDAD